MSCDGYYRHPTIYKDQVAFVCEDDLWTVSASGGIARRLTSGLGAAAFPALSSDGRLLAFSGRDTAAGKSYEAWVRKYWEKRQAGEKNIGIEAEKLD